MHPGSYAALAAGVVLATASFAAAQQAPPQPPPPRPGPAALSVPDPFAGLRPGNRDLYQSLDQSDRFQRLSRRHSDTRPRFFPGVYLPGPYYIPVAGMAEYPPQAGAVPPAAIARGGLTLETLPDLAQVYIDGFYVGLAQEFGLRGRALDLSAGAHRVELRAAGFETLSFSVLIAPHETLRYRGEMQALASKPAVIIVPSQPPPAKSVYVIPNCYAGDRLPTAALPTGCDLKSLRTR
jgi:hypothetical protein